jgi:hypothetical protein
MNIVDKVDVSKKSLERRILETMLFIMNSQFLVETFYCGAGIAWIDLPTCTSKWVRAINAYNKFCNTEM